MAFYGTNPTGGYFKMTPRATVPTFPGTYGHGDKEGTFYFNDGSGTITAGLWVYQGTGFAAITKNTEATEPQTEATDELTEQMALLSGSMEKVGKGA